MRRLIGMMSLISAASSAWLILATWLTHRATGEFNLIWAGSACAFLIGALLMANYGMNTGKKNVSNSN